MTKNISHCKEAIINRDINSNRVNGGMKCPAIMQTCSRSLYRVEKDEDVLQPQTSE